MNYSGKIKISATALLFLCLTLLVSVQYSGCQQPDLAFCPLDEALANGLPTLAEFGGSRCIPCKEMRPVLDGLAAEYKGKLNVVIVEVSEQQSLTERYGIVWIPVQIFFDATGKEVFRHSGVMPKQEIYKQLNRIGVK